LRLMTMRTIQGCRLLLSAFVEKLAFFHKTGFRRQALGTSSLTLQTLIIAYAEAGMARQWARISPAKIR
jgi:hypothetical protein